MEQTKIKKQPIYFNQHGYDHQLKNYGHRKQLEGFILTEFNKIGVKRFSFSKDILETFYTAIEERHKENNPLKLSGRKLCELLEIDDTLIKNHSLQFKNYIDVTKPRKDNFTLYAETDEELFRLDYVNRLIDILNETKDHRNIHRMEVLKVFGSIVKLNGISEYVVNPNFVKK